MNLTNVDKVIIATLKKYLPKININLPIILLGQQSKQGMQESGIYYDRVGSNHIGSPRRKYYFTGDTSDEISIIETQYRFSVMSLKDDIDPEYTALRLRDLMNSLWFTQDILKHNVSMHKAGDVVINTVQDHADNYLKVGTFEIRVGHIDTMVLDTPYTDNVETGIYRV